MLKNCFIKFQRMNCSFDYRWKFNEVDSDRSKANESVVVRIFLNQIRHIRILNYFFKELIAILVN